MIKVLVIVNDQPYGSERPSNALRLAGSLAKREQVELRVFLLSDAPRHTADGRSPWHLVEVVCGVDGAAMVESRCEAALPSGS